MKMLWTDRRLFIATLSILVLTLMSYRISENGKTDIVWAIVGIVGTIAGANAYQNVQQSKHQANSVRSQSDSPTSESGDAQPKRKK